MGEEGQQIFTAHLVRNTCAFKMTFNGLSISVIFPQATIGLLPSFPVIALLTLRCISSLSSGQAAFLTHQGCYFICLSILEKCVSKQFHYLVYVTHFVFGWTLNNTSGRLPFCLCQQPATLCVIGTFWKHSWRCGTKHCMLVIPKSLTGSPCAFRYQCHYRTFWGFPFHTCFFFPSDSLSCYLHETQKSLDKQNKRHTRIVRLQNVSKKIPGCLCIPK